MDKDRSEFIDDSTVSRRFYLDRHCLTQLGLVSRSEDRIR